MEDAVLIWGAFKASCSKEGLGVIKIIQFGEKEVEGRGKVEVSEIQTRG